MLRTFRVPPLAAAPLSLPNLLSALRLALAPVLVVLAWTGQPAAFLAVLVVALGSDACDGWIARRLGQETPLGTRLDSWGDLATYATVPLCAWWLWPDLLRREAPWVTAAVVAYLVPVAIGWLRYRRLTSYHTWGAKLSAVLVGASALLLFAGGPALPFRIATLVLVLAELEEIAITATLPVWRANVPTLRHARRLRRELARAGGCASLDRR
jgi:CDP-diacylglycerol--glycerol-3-phosphate 3-phosphatidyltransferase